MLACLSAAAAAGRSSSTASWRGPPRKCSITRDNQPWFRLRCLKFCTKGKRRKGNKLNVSKQFFTTIYLILHDSTFLLSGNYLCLSAESFRLGSWEMTYGDLNKCHIPYLLTSNYTFLYKILELFLTDGLYSIYQGKEWFKNGGMIWWHMAIEMVCIQCIITISDRVWKIDKGKKYHPPGTRWRFSLALRATTCDFQMG